MVASIVHPNLYDADLQDSYGERHRRFIEGMIDDPVNNEFAAFIQQYNGFDTTMDEKVEEAKTN